MADEQNLLTAGIDWVPQGSISDEQMSRAQAQQSGPSWWNLLTALPGIPKRAMNAMVNASLTDMLSGAGHMIKSGATVAGDVAKGNQPTYDPLTGHVPDSLINRAQDMYLGTQMTGLPVAATSVPTNSLGTLIGKRAKTWNSEMADTARIAEKMGVPINEVWQKTGYGSQGFADKMMRSEIPDVRSFINEAPLGKPVVKLGNMLEHPELYKAYPELANTLVKKEYMSNPEILGGYHPGTGDITLNAARLPSMDLDRMRKIMLHETGHAIESKEGFARGGHHQEFLPQDFDVRYEAALNKARDVSRGTGADLLALLGKYGIDPTKSGEVMKQFARGMPEQLPSTDILSKYSPQTQGFIKDLYNHKKLIDMAKVIKNDLLPLEDMQQQAIENYKRLTGEVHQRAVMDRAWSPANTLREVPPWESFDRPVDKQIVRF